MSRSTRKGPYIHPSLMKKITVMNAQKDKKVIKTWARDSSVFPEMVGHTIAIHDGKKHVPRTWSATCWASLRRPDASAPTATTPRSRRH